MPRVNTVLRDAIVPAMRRLEAPVTAADLHQRAKLGKSPEHVACAMRALERDGILHSVGKGRYATLSWVIDQQEQQREAERKVLARLEPLLDDIREEFGRATTKFPTWPTDPLHALAVLGEEYGELTKAMLQLTYEPHKTSAAEVRAEAIQTAAMALRLAMSLGVYDYQPCAQHSQSE